MNKVMAIAAVAIVAAIGISAFTLMSSESGEVTTNVQQPVADKPVPISATNSSLFPC